jgi:MFS superfamily sulfate permease-like transporter
MVLHILVYLKFINLIKFTTSIIFISILITILFYIYGILNPHIYKEKIEFEKLYSLNKKNIINNNKHLTKIKINNKIYFFNLPNLEKKYEKNIKYIQIKTIKCLSRKDFNYTNGFYNKDYTCDKEIKKEILIPITFKIIKD